jgi:uncharacterized protein YgbK (DUF1537 family)
MNVIPATPASPAPPLTSITPAAPVLPARGILIVADDLSGAADCAIAFASAGRHTVVTLDALHARADDAAGIDVIAADTDTRRLAPDEAARRTSEAYTALTTPGRRLYKKIDSTLRGNWAAEVAALQPLAGLAIVAPAFPATGRTTRGARVLVHGEPLESTHTWKLENADRPANLRTMLEEAGLRCDSVEVQMLRGDADVLRICILAAIKEGVGALVVDAETSEDLKRLGEITAPLDQELFWVGSGGLARELATLGNVFSASPRKPLIHEKLEGSILVLVGSLSPVSERQCEMLRERAGIAELIVPPAILRQGPGHGNKHLERTEWSQWQSKIGEILLKRLDLLVRIGRDEAFDPAEGVHLSNALAELVAPHFEHVGGLIATGGETARAMLTATGISRLDLLAEVEAGVAVARPSAPLAARPAIVTKAGAFGSEHALFGSWQYLQRLPTLTANTY